MKNNYIDNIGLIKKGTLSVNKTDFNVSGWRVKIYFNQHKEVIILLEELKNGKFEYWYDFMVLKELDIPKFFAETNWEIEWQK